MVAWSLAKHQGQPIRRAALGTYSNYYIESNSDYYQESKRRWVEKHIGAAEIIDPEAWRAIHPVTQHPLTKTQLGLSKLPVYTPKPIDPLFVKKERKPYYVKTGRPRGRPLGWRKLKAGPPSFDTFGITMGL